MDADEQLSRAQFIVAKSAHVRNVAGSYNDYSTANIKSFHISNSGRHEMDPLLKHVAHGALHDSAERGPDAPKCHPETRTAVQKDIMGWIKHYDEDDTPKKILWLSGPAGSGKTAIAGTIADECYQKGMLAATFFFSAFAGSIDRRLSKNVISTLLYSLLQHKSIVGLKEEVLAIINDDPIVFERHLDQQLEKLILGPLRKVAGRSDRPHWPKVIIVDGLDECEGGSESDIVDPASGTKAQKEVLSALSRACTDPAFPFRVIIASRPEPTIRHFFSASPGLALNIFLDDKYNPDADIRLFLEATFSDIRRRFSLALTWPATDVVDLLVEQASGQFIYAATVIRFLDNPRLGPPQTQLNRLLEWRRLDSQEPFAPLDALYNRIMQTSPDPLLAAKWLLVLPTYESEPEYFKRLLETSPGETEYILGSLTSLVGLVDENGRPRFYFYHKSLLDFLRDPHRSSDLHANEESLIHFLQDRYYEILRGRGLQPGADPLTNPPSRNFLVIFCEWLVAYIDPRRRYTSGDVEWWLANLLIQDRSKYIPWMFVPIHRQCKWYRCLPACGVWRKGILRCCREHGWRLPTKMEMLQDRFKKFKFDYHLPREFPLRAPVTEPAFAETISAEPTTIDSPPL